jgi:hypothetical protein
MLNGLREIGCFSELLKNKIYLMKLLTCKTILYGEVFYVSGSSLCQ